jgi:diguanylate cyclase (GGDEF)-like protein/PAS domain S-box-containing protein
MLARDGRAVWIRESGTLVRTEGDGSQVWHGVMFDITELKGIERGLREAEERYRTLVERVPPAIYIQRPREGEAAAYDTTYMSPRVQDVLGYPPTRFLGDPGFWDEVVHPEDRQKVLAEDERTDETGEPFFMEYRVIAEDGSTVWVRDEATLIRDDAGQPLYWLGALTEVTERRRAEEALKQSEERYRALTQNSSDLVTLMAATGVILYQSPAVGRVLGYPPEELVGNNAFDYVHPDDVRRAETAFAEGLEDPNLYPLLEYRFRHADGSWRWLESVGTNLLGDPAVGAYVVNSRDITGRKEAEDELRKSEERLRGLANAAFEGILITDRGQVLEANLALADMLGYGLPEIVGRSALEFVALEHRDMVRRKIASGSEDPYEIVGIKQDGSSLDLEVRGRAYSYRGRSVRVTAVRDVTERKAFERRLRHQALHDSLTGLPNRKLFMDRLGHALERTRRTRGRKVAVLLMDLDGFKLVNDSLGHEAGDLLLVLVAERLRTCLRPEDTLARFGGDEFVVLVENVETSAEALGVARRITEELRKPLVMESANLFSSASIGVALGDARTKTPDVLLRDADTAMYRAKKEHAVHRVFHPSMYERAVGRLELENDLRRAIDREEFVVHYQPIVSLQTGETWGLEALVRWEHPERGLLAPSEFVPAAEESGLVVPMGEFVLEEACRWAVERREGHPQALPLVMSVNLSARQLARPDLAETVEGALRKTGLDPSRLSLDVTETSYMSVLEERSFALDHLKRLGVGVSIDDFGVGHSSLSYLKRLPADTLKIDRSFVRGVGDGLEDAAIVRMVVELAHTLGMRVVAEGVEGHAQAALLAEMGCDFAQGYLFSRPLPPDAVSEFLAN